MLEMSFVIEPVTTASDAALATSVRDKIFGREQKILVPQLPKWNSSEALTLVAKARAQSAPVAVLTVIETTGDDKLHDNFGLVFPPGTRVARYTQLAVVKSYRGLQLPIQLVLEARRRFVLPRDIEYTWLLFDAKRAASSSFCRTFGYRPSSGVFETEYGFNRVLLRHEVGTVVECDHDWCVEYVPVHANEHRTAPGTLFRPRQLGADEWVAQ
jgi:hypothetical protein